ncbi:hypothetical protein O181_079793 [Austropuccinia psidii MF-1]|uniref:Uncharacterized protein n=1 Tax=Austropuccinia psidii MF-1 TaxID=1389203 RepID=A0A9Q3FHF9_9BASI|nr:hypothetical protein [Austropuccinia psidii MF-1]
MTCLVLPLNLDSKMSSKVTSICDSDHSDSPPSVLYGAGVFDNFRELSEESMAPTEIWDIKKTYNGFKSVRVIEPPCVNCQRKGITCVESAIDRSTRCQFCNLGKRNCSQAHYRFPDNPRKLWSSIKKGGRFGLEAPVDEPPTFDASSGHSNYEIDTDAEGSDEIDGEELEITPPIQKIRIQSTSKLPVQASTSNNEVIRSPQPPQLPIRSPTRPSTVASISTSIQPPVASTSRDPMSPEPESIFEACCHWNITRNFTDHKRVNKKVVTSLFAEFDALTEVFVDKAMKSAIPGKPTIAYE